MGYVSEPIFIFRDLQLANGLLSYQIFVEWYQTIRGIFLARLHSAEWVAQSVLSHEQGWLDISYIVSRWLSSDFT